MIRLRNLPLAARLGLTAALGVLAIGAWASLVQIDKQHAKNDGLEGLSFEDVAGAYHGVLIEAPLVSMLTTDALHPPTLTEDERRGLLEWVEGDSLIDGYDDFDLDDMAPAMILERRCVECHAAGSGVAGAESMPLEYFDQVERVVQSKELTPTPWPILLTSIHTHATSVGTLVVVVGLLACLTRFARPVRSLPMLLGGAGLLLDIGGQLLARAEALFVWGVLGGGALFGTGLALGMVLVAAELWLPRTSPED